MSISQHIGPSFSGPAFSCPSFSTPPPPKKKMQNVEEEGKHQCTTLQDISSRKEAIETGRTPV